MIVDDDSIDLTMEMPKLSKSSEAKKARKDLPKWMECIICLDPIKQPSSTK